jgi:hypothetical protein
MAGQNRQPGRLLSPACAVAAKSVRQLPALVRSHRLEELPCSGGAKHRRNEDANSRGPYSFSSFSCFAALRICLLTCFMRLMSERS